MTNRVGGGFFASSYSSSSSEPSSPAASPAKSGGSRHSDDSFGSPGVSPFTSPLKAFGASSFRTPPRKRLIGALDESGERIADASSRSLGSPTRSIHPMPSQETPEKLRTMLRHLSHELDPDDFQGEATRRTKRVLSAGVEGLDEATDTPCKRRRSSKARLCFQIVENQAAEGAQDPVQRQRALVECAKVRTWGQFLQKLKDADAACQHPAEHLPPVQPVIDVAHILDPEGGGGFHYCPPGHALYHQLTGRRYLSNGTFTAQFPIAAGKSSKRSTFFSSDRFVNGAALIEAIAKSRLIAQYASRSLREIAAEGPQQPLMIEVFHGVGYYRSAFPLFFECFDNSRDDYTIVVGERAVPASEILAKAAGMLDAYLSSKRPISESPIRYLLGKGESLQVVLDLSSAFPEWGFKGLYFSFSEQALRSVVVEGVEDAIDELRPTADDDFLIS